jgi:type VI secretion system secreted protein VgrG
MKNHFEISVDGTKSTTFQVTSVAGYESLSQPSLYETTLVSKNRHETPFDLLGKVVDIKYSFEDAEGKSHDRFFSGVAVKMIRGKSYERFFEYKVTVRSWFWLLTKRKNSRIFQDKTVLQIIDTVFADKPISKYVLIDKENVKLKHTIRSYCVQYQETDFEFISRLLAWEGIAYHFDCHSKQGCMTLTDDYFVSAQPLPASPILIAMPNGATEARFNQVDSWTRVDRLVSGGFVGQDVSYKNIMKTKVQTTNVQDFVEEPLEQYEFPYGSSINEGKAGTEFELTEEEDKAIVDSREFECAHRSQHWWITTPWPDISPGAKLTFEGPKADKHNTDYLTGTSVFSLNEPIVGADAPKQANYSMFDSLIATIQADPMLEEATEDALKVLRRIGIDQNSNPRTNHFFAALYFFGTPFKPFRIKQRLMMLGPQTAMVVGGQGKEHDVDAMGRVKVKFFWDRDLEKKQDTTCWIRVSQPMAGKGWGGYFAPRVGQEVIVDFLNGDPDKPIIVGRVYNNEQPIPYPSATQSGFKTRSTPNGTPSNFNEIKFEDKKGAEELHLQAERNMSTLVKVDQSTSVGHNQSFSVDHDQTTSVNNDRTLNVTKKDKNIIGLQQQNYVGTNQINVVKLVQSTLVGQVQATVVGAGQFLEVGAGGQHEKIAGDRHITAKSNDTLAVTGAHKVKVKGDSSLEAANILFRSKGKRTDASVGKHVILSDADIMLAANNEISLIAMSSVNTMTPCTNTTVLGASTNTHIGQFTAANMGPSATTYLGMRTEFSAGLSSSVFMGLQTNTTVGPKFETSVLGMKMAPMQIFSAGGGGGGPGAAKIWQGVAAIAGLVSAGVGNSYSIKNAQDIYAHNVQVIKDAVKEADAAKMPALSSRLKQMQKLAEDPSFFSADSMPNISADPAVDKSIDMVNSDDAGMGLYGPIQNPTPAQSAAMAAESAKVDQQQLMQEGSGTNAKKPNAH